MWCWPRWPGCYGEGGERLVRTRGGVVDDIDVVIDALERFRQGSDPAEMP
jgi:hypothetical protein